jgi:hypothetical protein
MHTYSRAPIAEGQEFIDQAVARAGHHVNFHEVRYDKIPKISSIEERNKYFLVEIDDNGTLAVHPDYQNVICFLHKVQIDVIENTNGESYRIVNEKGESFRNFIDPSDCTISGTMSDGYEFRLFSANDDLISRNYGWDFDPFNGILHFDSNFKPGCKAWEEKGFGKPTFEGFIYVGKYANQAANDVNKNIEESKADIRAVIENSIAIKPYQFSTAIMTLIDEPYLAQVPHKYDGIKEYFQRFTFIVPGYCFELTSLDHDQTVLTEMRHLPNGDTQIFLDLPYDIKAKRTIVEYSCNPESNGIGYRVPILGHWHFIATCFIKANGGKIKVENITNCETDEFKIIEPNDSYTYILDQEDFDNIEGDGVPWHCHCEHESHGYTINING